MSERHHSSRLPAALALVTLLVPASASAQSAIRTDRIFEAIGIREGATICEIGAGDGELTIAAARRVGPQGRVYTSELGDERVKALRAKIAGSELPHIAVVPGDPVKTNFPDGECEALFMRNVYHHFADPAAMNASIARAVAPGGRVAIVDFTARSGKEAASPADRDEEATHGVSPESVSRELKEAGLEHLLTEQSTERWFMVVAAAPVRESR
jgi:ubiquinone/menaquinone biosynthesis C-methylase UbiE